MTRLGRVFSAFALAAFIATFGIRVSGTGFPTEALARGPTPAKARKAKLAWEPLDRAVRYEIEVSASSAMEGDTQKKQSDTNSVTLSLVPGRYYFRVRGLDAEGKAGPWSDVSALEVGTPPPVPLSPADGKTIESLQANGELLFKWKREGGEKENILEITGPKGKVFTRSFTSESYAWKPEEPGRYRWRLGSRQRGSESWGPYQEFTVKRSALRIEPEPAAHEPAPEPPAQVASEAETWLIARVAQSVVAYQVRDFDSGVSSSGAALVGLYSAELRWRAARSSNGQGSAWGLSGALNLELINQDVLETRFRLPRGYARVFAMKDASPTWRLGPFVQLNVNRSGIFVVQSATQALTATITRKGFGLGVSAVYRPTTKMLLSWLALVRLDTGGEASTLPGPVESTLGYEAGFGVALSLSKPLMLEGRLRALNESFSWPSSPASGGADSPSSLNSTFIIFDLGLGYRF